MSDEEPPEDKAPRTPAEAAGATPLDPEQFRRLGPNAMLNRNREIEGEIQLDPIQPRVVRRSRQLHQRGPNPLVPVLVVLAVVATLAGGGLIAAALLGRSSAEPAPSAPPELVLATPVLSARRGADAIVAPIAQRNLAAAVAPVIAQMPADSCVTIRDGRMALENHNEAIALVPASNMKVVTAAAALALLDPQGRLSTKFLTDGTPTDGSVIEGNLYMVGGGDPLLSTEAYVAQLPNGRQPATDMAAVADQIVATGVRTITGSVVGDESRYDSVRTPEAWPERYLTQGQAGRLSALMVNDAWTLGSGPASDPAQHAAAVLTELLRARGVTVAGTPAAGTAPEKAPTLTEVPSLTITELVSEMLTFSDNTTAELLTKEMGLETSGDPSTAGGVAAIAAWLGSAGLPADGVVIDDGSGLSENNRLTCVVLGSILVGDGADGPLANGLARNGEPGTLHDRMLGPALAGRVRAKTGTLRPATSLSGWLRTDPEANLAFAILENRPGGQVSAADTALQAGLLEAMLGYPDAPPADSIAPLPPVAFG